MTDPSLALTPDDGQHEHEHIELLEQHSAPEQPYGLASWSIGLLALLLLRGLLHGAESFLLFSCALIIVLVSYMLLSGLRPKLPLFAFVTLAAELGLLYSLPYDLLYKSTWHDAASAANLLTGILLAAIAGVLLGRGLEVKQHPSAVIGISFLMMFVFVNLVYMVLTR